MGTINMNGMNFTSANSIVIKNNKVIIDGKDVTPDSKKILIQVDGDIDYIESDIVDSIEVIGTVGSVKTHQGDIEVTGTVKGDAKTHMGNIKAKKIEGNAKTHMGNIRKGIV